MVSPLTHCPSPYQTPADHAEEQDNWEVGIGFVFQNDSMKWTMSLCVRSKRDSFYWLWKGVKREKSSAETQHLPLHNKKEDGYRNRWWINEPWALLNLLTVTQSSPFCFLLHFHPIKCQVIWYHIIIICTARLILFCVMYEHKCKHLQWWQGCVKG